MPACLLAFQLGASIFEQIFAILGYFGGSPGYF